MISLLHSRRLSVVILSLAAATAGGQDTLVQRLPPAVTVTRGVGRSTLDLPFAISSTVPDSARPGQIHAWADQTLFQLPGVTVANRFNPSQDTRLVIRGFGARSQFGARSIRILRDGMPLTLPDGQTPIDYLDLEAVGRLEVIRGSAAALYGNASGGVIDIRSAPPPKTPVQVEGRYFMGSDGFTRRTVLVGGTLRDVWYQANVGQTRADTADAGDTLSTRRAYSGQRLTNGFLRAGTTVAGTQLALTALGLDMPLAQNPGAVSAKLADSLPLAADSVSRARRARKEVQQLQVGLSASRAVGRDGELSAQVYTGRRALYNPLTFAVVDVDRRINGGSVRLTGMTTRLSMIPALAESRVSYVLGYDHQWMGDDRRNWAICNAVQTATANCPSVPAEKGVLQLDQREAVTSGGGFVRADLDIDRVRLTAGVRTDRLTFRLTDHFETDGRDDSGERTMRATSPLFGLGVRFAALHSAYVNYSTAFETPTTTELGNHADGSAGLNPDLDPQHATTVEVGVKGLALSRLVYDVALYEAHVRDELIPFEVATGQGRTYSRNAGRTKRRGAEAAVSSTIDRLTVTATYTLSDFRFEEFATATTTFDGRAIPGIPDRQAQLSAMWRTPGYFAVAEWSAKSKVWVNDGNTTSAAGFALVHVRAGGWVSYGRSMFTPIGGIQNVFDRKHISSVAINAAAATAKYFEPGGGRSYYVGLQVRP